MKVDILVRTYNEQRWISSLFLALSHQSYPINQVLIVDSESTDDTLLLARAWSEKLPIKTLSLKNYQPGASLNLGFSHSTADALAIISAHCIPLDCRWLSSLVDPLYSNHNISVVYGRQIGLLCTPLPEIRDMENLFRSEHQIQYKDTFFHNANSLIKRQAWAKHPFNEHIKHIEEREFGNNVINSGNSIAYNPDAAVYHHHGLHQQDYECPRAAGIAEILISNNPKISTEPLYHSINTRKAAFFYKYKENPSSLSRVISYMESLCALPANLLGSITIVFTEDTLMREVTSELQIRATWHQEMKINFALDSDLDIDERDSLDSVIYNSYSFSKKVSSGFPPDIICFSSSKYIPPSPECIYQTVRSLILYNYDSVQTASYITANLWKLDSSKVNHASYSPLKENLRPLQCVPQLLEAKPSMFSAFHCDKLATNTPLLKMNTGFFFIN